MAFHQLKESDDLIKQDPKTIEEQIIDFIIAQKDVARATKALQLSAIVSFYSINDITLNRKRLGKFLGPKQKRVKDRPYTLEEISKMLAVSDERMKCVVLILTSTGMRIGGSCWPKDFFTEKDGLDGHKIYRLTVTREVLRSTFVLQLPNVLQSLICI